MQRKRRLQAISNRKNINLVKSLGNKSLQHSMKRRKYKERTHNVNVDEDIRREGSSCEKGEV